MILRVKNKSLFPGVLTPEQQSNSRLNLAESESKATILHSYPRRIITELTNDCNLRCTMCGRVHADFKPSFFLPAWFDHLEAAFQQSEEIVLHGWGEPTIHPQFAEILQYLDQFPLRKYFCTNGHRLEAISDSLFRHHLDILAVSLDGADSSTNDSIRVGASFERIIAALKGIIWYKQSNRLTYPYVNIVFTAMQKNIRQLPEMIRLAAETGIDEVKVVYLTAFSRDLEGETLYQEYDLLKDVFRRSAAMAAEKNIRIKLPYLMGEDPSGSLSHRECFFPWRDLFIGSNGYIRPCVSAAEELFHLASQSDFVQIWNHPQLSAYRHAVNDPQLMTVECRKCYHSTCANWNKKQSFIQTGECFSPQWRG